MICAHGPAVACSKFRISGALFFSEFGGGVSAPWKSMQMLSLQISLFCSWRGGKSAYSARSTGSTLVFVSSRQVVLELHLAWLCRGGEIERPQSWREKQSQTVGEGSVACQSAVAVWAAYCIAQ